MWKKNVLTCFAACTLTVGASGCWYLAAGAIAAGGTYAYVKGQLQETLAAPVSEVTAATDLAIEQLALREVRRKVDGVVGHYDLKTADNQTVTIHIESTGEGTTRIGIRVGAVGDRNLSERILQAIRANL